MKEELKDLRARIKEHEALQKELKSPGDQLWADAEREGLCGKFMDLKYPKPTEL